MPVLLALFSLVTVLALPWRWGRQIPAPVTGWYRTHEATFSDCLALVRGHLWRARYLVTSPPQGAFVPFPLEAFELLFTRLPLAA
jgi:hypothetical protein